MKQADYNGNGEGEEILYATLAIGVGKFQRAWFGEI